MNPLDDLDDSQASLALAKMNVHTIRREKSKRNRPHRLHANDDSSPFARFYASRHKEHRKAIAQRKTAAHLRQQVENAVDASLKGLRPLQPPKTKPRKHPEKKED